MIGECEDKELFPPPPHLTCCCLFISCISFNQSLNHSVVLHISYANHGEQIYSIEL